MFISFFEKKRTKESDPKLMLLPALAKGNIYGKRVVFKHLPANLPKLFEAKTTSAFARICMPFVIHSNAGSQFWDAYPPDVFANE